jgi:hypothetical protein
MKIVITDWKVKYMSVIHENSSNGLESEIHVRYP